MEMSPGVRKISSVVTRALVVCLADLLDVGWRLSKESESYMLTLVGMSTLDISTVGRNGYC